MKNHSNDDHSTIYQKFLAILSQSGLLLMIATVAALVWANSSFGGFYEQLWHHTYFTIGFDELQLHKHLIHWINDGLMAIFFFVVGLEIKREIVVGELKSAKQAALPIFAALGGMVVPVVFFKLFGLTGEASQGWGIPMATDIAFSIAVLALLGSRVPLSLKIFLTALAIADDLGAVLVIALFYTHSLNWILIVIATSLLLVLVILNRLKFQNLWAYTAIGFVIWGLFLFSGIHATIAGVIVAFTIPIYPKVKVKEFSDRVTKELRDFTTDNINIGHEKSTIMLNESQMEALDKLQHSVISVQSPLQRLEHDLGRVVNYAILPLFALANAGVVLVAHQTAESSLATQSAFSDLGIAIAVSLVFGKAIGISLFSWIAIKLKMADKPTGGSLASFIGLGLLGGIGFTMSLFITTLAFQSPDLISQAKIGIFIGSLIAGILGYLVLKFSLSSGTDKQS